VADAREIARVQAAGWRVGYAELVPAAVLAELDERERESRWRDLLPDTPVLVAQAGGGRLAGFLSLAIPARALGEIGVGEITALYVDPTSWRRGFGRALMDAAAADLRDEGCDAAVLWVLEANHRGRAFYAALGFAPDGARAVHERTGVPEIRLRARLD